MELRCDNIQYSIEGSRILNGISLGVSNNEFHTILGPNGCGKTTFLKTVYRITKPDLGTIYLDGKPLDNISIRKSAQNMAVYPGHGEGTSVGYERVNNPFLV